MRTIVADDEPLGRDKLRLLLNEERGVEVVAECQSGEETLNALKSYEPDLLLLDIRMPDMDGFQVLREIPVQKMPVVIFTTAYDQYAVRAFEAHALDYLLKPFDRERLHHAINRARAELITMRHREMTHRMLEFLEDRPGSSTAAKDRRLVLKTGGRVVFLNFEEIDWVEAAANYVKLNAGNQSYLLREGIGHVTDKLDPAQFIRIHRSTVVNVHKIKELQPVNSGEYIVVLKNGKELSCSRGYRLSLQRLIENSL